MRTLLLGVAAAVFSLGVTGIADAQKAGKGGSSNRAQVQHRGGGGHGQVNRGGHGGQHQGHSGHTGQNQGQAHRPGDGHAGHSGQGQVHRQGDGHGHSNWSWNNGHNSWSWNRGHGGWRWSSPRFYGSGYGYGSYPRYGYSSGYGYDPYYSSGSYYGPYNYGSPTSYATQPGPVQSPAGANQAQLQVILPDANAEVALNGEKIPSSGRDRTFVSPPLQAGQQYSYTVTASWTQAGRPVSDTRTVAVTPGRVIVVDFTRPAA